MMARMFKVPHHGSSDADEVAIWNDHLRADAVYAVTRFNNGDRSLPGDDDRARMRGRNPAGHVVGAPSDGVIVRLPTVKRWPQAAVPALLARERG